MQKHVKKGGEEKFADKSTLVLLCDSLNGMLLLLD